MKKCILKLREKKGFTLVEVLITVALLSILAGITSPVFTPPVIQPNTGSVDSNVNRLYFQVQDALVDLRSNGTYYDEVTTNRAEAYWRGFNSTSGGYDIAYMVEYPDTYLYNGVEYPIDWSSSILGTNNENYQLTNLTKLIEPKEGWVQAYGILFELYTGTVLEVSLIQIPYDDSNSATLNQNVENAAKITADVVGTLILNDISSKVLSVSSSSAYYNNAYGITHVFDRSYLAESYYPTRRNYCATSYSNLPTHLNNFGYTLDETILSFCG